VEEGFLSRSWRNAARAGAIGALALAAACSRPSHAGSGPAPTDAAGIQARLEGARGRPVLLSFWATWCKPCVEEIPGLVELHTDRKRGVHVIAVSLDNFLSGDAKAVDVVNEFLAKTPAPLEHLVYRGGQDELLGAFDLPGNIPFAILYNAGGRPVARFGTAEPAAVRAALASPEAQ
jgi:thiol-disulfide isomerase/thioredoxin